jgi:DNA-binding CsgD family transcriptional regulator
MEPDIKILHSVWENVLASKEKAIYSSPSLDEILSSIYALGPFYYYFVDFSDFSLSNISSQAETLHGVPLNEFRILGDIVKLMHPDDIPMVAAFEEAAYRMALEKIGPEKALKYKSCYNFRFKTTDGSYKLFNHQALVLQVDLDYKVVKSLNIHTQIDHLVKENNNCFSLIGLMGEPSFLNIPINVPIDISNRAPVYSSREIEIIGLLSQGFTCPQIAKKIFLSVHTINTHRKNLLAKSASKNTAELVAKAISGGFV